MILTILNVCDLQLAKACHATWLHTSFFFISGIITHSYILGLNVNPINISVVEKKFTLNLDLYTPGQPCLTVTSECILDHKILLHLLTIETDKHLMLWRMALSLNSP